MYKVFASGTKSPIGQYKTLKDLSKSLGLNHQTVYNALSGDPYNDAEHDGYEIYRVDDTDGGDLYIQTNPLRRKRRKSSSVSKWNNGNPLRKKNRKSSSVSNSSDGVVMLGLIVTGLAAVWWIKRSKPA